MGFLCPGMERGRKEQQGEDKGKLKLWRSCPYRMVTPRTDRDRDYWIVTVPVSLVARPGMGGCLRTV